MRTLADIGREVYGVPAALLSIAGSFSVVALLLAGIGLYGLMSWLVVQQTHEFSIRAAVGATPRDLITLVMRRGLSAAALGLVLGAAGGLAVTRVLRSVLHEIEAQTTVALLTSVAVLVLALWASWLPARRVARLDPMCGLRE